MARRKAKRDGAPKKKVRKAPAKGRAKRPSRTARARAAVEATAPASAPTSQDTMERPAAANSSARVAAPAGPTDDRMKRAEQLVDRIGEGVGSCTNWVGQQLLHLAARAREQVADIVAEAQHLRQRNSH